MTLDANTQISGQRCVRHGKVSYSPQIPALRVQAVSGGGLVRQRIDGGVFGHHVAGAPFEDGIQHNRN